MYNVFLFVYNFNSRMAAVSILRVRTDHVLREHTRIQSTAGLLDLLYIASLFVAVSGYLE